MLYYENLAVSIDPFNLHWEPQKKKSSWYMLAIWEDIHAIDCFFLFTKCMLYWRISRLPWWLSGKESTCQCWRHGFDPWSRRIPPAMGQLSLCATTTDAQVPRAHVLREQWAALCTAMKSSLRLPQLEKAHVQQWSPCAAVKTKDSQK